MACVYSGAGAQLVRVPPVTSLHRFAALTSNLLRRDSRNIDLIREIGLPTQQTCRCSTLAIACINVIVAFSPGFSLPCDTKHRSAIPDHTPPLTTSYRLGLFPGVEVPAGTKDGSLKLSSLGLIWGSRRRFSLPSRHDIRFLRRMVSQSRNRSVRRRLLEPLLVACFLACW